MEIERHYDFCDAGVIDKKEYKEMNDVCIDSNLQRFLLVICFLALLCLPVKGVTMQDSGLLGLSGLLWVESCLMLIFSRRRKKLEEQRFCMVGEEISYNVSFGEKILLKGKDNNSKEIGYDLVRSIRETAKYYILILDAKLSITVSKDIKGADESAEFIPYLIQKCPNLKKKKVAKMMPKKKLILLFFSIITMVFLLNLLFFILY